MVPLSSESRISTSSDSNVAVRWLACSLRNMRLRARSPELHGQELSARLLPGGDPSHGFPMVRVEGGLQLSLEVALQNYEVIDATPEERAVLQQWGHPFGGVQ